jgi:ribosome-binding protein aMBF1 (putative translation factor)
MASDEASEPDGGLSPGVRLSAAMRAAREAKGLSRRQFAQRLEWSHSNLAD